VYSAEVDADAFRVMLQMFPVILHETPATLQATNATLHASASAVAVCIHVRRPRPPNRPGK